MAIILNYELRPGEIEEVLTDADEYPVADLNSIAFWQGILRVDISFIVDGVDLSLSYGHLVQFTIYATSAMMEIEQGATRSLYYDSESGYCLEFMRDNDNVVVSRCDYGQNRSAVSTVADLSSAFSAFAKRVYDDLCNELPGLSENEWFEDAFSRISRKELPPPNI